MTPDFEDLLACLNAAGARYVIVGGYAEGIDAEPRTTTDLDIFIETDAANGEAVWRALARFEVTSPDVTTRHTSTVDAAAASD